MQTDTGNETEYLPFTAGSDRPGISFADLRRAALNGGDVSVYGAVYSQAMGGSPVPVASGFDLPIPLPPPEVFARTVFIGLPDVSRDRGPSSKMLDRLDQLDLVMIENKHRLGDGRILTRNIERLNPDLIVVDFSPSELSAHILYAFSLPCALGLGAQLEMVSGGSLEPHFDGLFYPANIGIMAVIESWRRKIPLLAIGSPLNSRTEQHFDAVYYPTSRFIDIADSLAVSGRKLRVLALMDSDIYRDLDVLFSSRDNITAPAYIPRRADTAWNNTEIFGTCLEPLELDGEEADAGPAHQLFLTSFEKVVRDMDTAPLTLDEARHLVAGIVNRLRRHNEVIGGPSVRGSLACEEIMTGLARLNGVFSRPSIAKAAAIALPHRIVVKRKGLEASIITDVVKEVLYGIRFSSQTPVPNDRASSRRFSGDLPGDLDNAAAFKKSIDPDGESSDSFAVVSTEHPELESAGVLGKGNISPEDAREEYWSMKKALSMMMGDLHDQLNAGTITREEYEQRRYALMSRLRDYVRSHLNVSGQEMATTIIEMMDAQDSGWNKDLNFNTMNLYYHIKGTSEKKELSPFKKDYHALKWLIDDLQARDIVRQDCPDAGFLITGFALYDLLEFLIEKDPVGRPSNLSSISNGVPADFPGHQTRRYRLGDTFRDISVRHTLKEIARQKKRLSDVRYKDLRVFLKEYQRPQMDLVFCVDTSGSMGFNQRLTCARLATAGLVRAAMRDGNRVGVVAFNDYTQTSVPLTADDEISILNSIAALHAAGNTNIGDGLKSARELLHRQHSRNRKHIVLISDGQASAVSKETLPELQKLKKRDLTEESALLEAGKVAASGMSLSVIYIAPKNVAVDTFINNIAKIGKGKVYRMTGLSDLNDVLRKWPAHRMGD